VETGFPSSQHAYIPPNRADAAEPPALETVREDPRLMTAM